jgi:alkylated DNA repair dioxygenase AlkB
MHDRPLIGESLAMPDADVVFYPGFYSSEENELFFQTLMQKIVWKSEHIQIAGRKVLLPRLTAWYGDEGKVYHYSGITVHPVGWTDLLRQIKSRVETVAETSFNSVLLNLYPNEQASVSWHSDDEPELGVNPVIASVSFGVARNFQLKHKHLPDERREILLTPGSLLLMRGTTQHFWKHRIPKTTKPHGPRINLTFRVIA